METEAGVTMARPGPTAQERTGLPFRKADTVPEKPAQFEQMESIAQKLSEGLPFLRVDMYCIESTIYVGEMTFYHYGGFIPFRPEEWDGRIGEMLDLSAVKREI